jgi:hypothetical protein
MRVHNPTRRGIFVNVLNRTIWPDQTLIVSREQAESLKNSPILEVDLEEESEPATRRTVARGSQRVETNAAPEYETREAHQ